MKNKKIHVKKKIKTYKTKYIVAIFIVTLIILSGILIARSRYVLKSNVVGLIKADAFYFNSYTLDEGEKQINTDSIEFKIYNYEDALRTSEKDIEYEIKAEVITPKNSNITTKVFINGEEKSTGILTGGAKTTDTVEIKLENDEAITENVSVRVYAIAKSPYTKNIGAIYNIKKSNTTDNYEANLKTGNEYENLLIRTYDYSGKIELSFENSKLKVYDEKQENVEISGNIVTLMVNKNSNYSIKFIKLTSDTINLGKDIIINKK